MSGLKSMLPEIWAALGGDVARLADLRETGEGGWPSAFAIGDFAAATTAAAALALADLVAGPGKPGPSVAVDRRLASLWFAKSIRPVGWTIPSPWDPIAGNYAARDGWIRLHTNAPHHRAAALAVLGCAGEREAVAKVVASWSAQELEDAVVAAGGCAGLMRSLPEWRAHPQGQAVAAEPLVAWSTTSARREPRAFGAPGRPLAGLRVLDLTRVLAGPVATRFLAGYGADVLRIDSPDWDEPAVLPEVTPGKTRARLDLRDTAQARIFGELLEQADVIVHGYRSDALERLGFSAGLRARKAPGLIDVALDAYGWTGPWARRRGFDTVVQMSAGIAASEAEALGSDKPEQMPVQALDFGTGHLVTAAVLRGLADARADWQGRSARLSLARSAAFLTRFRAEARESLAPETDDDLAPGTEATRWGPARRLKPAHQVEGFEFRWDRPAGPLGDGAPAFATE